MDREVMYDGKPLRVRLTRNAEQALAERVTPLVAEMELYFSCLIRKRVRFHAEVPDDHCQPVSPNLSISFHPVMTEQCRLDDSAQGEVPKAEFPITNPAAFLPHWLNIDYRKGEWCGEFGYT
jgi:hypothetical protein